MPRTVRAVSLTCYVEVARFVGLDPHALLRAHGISPRQLENPEWRIDAAAAVSLLEETAARAGRQDIGILMAQCRSFASLGPLSLLIEHVATPRDAIGALNEFRHLLNALFALHLEEHGDTAIIRCDILSADAGLQVSSNAVAILFRTLSDSSGGRWHPDVVHFTYPRPADIGTFSAYFQCAIEFDSSFEGMTCARRLLDVANPRADPLLARHARGLLELMPATPAAADSILDRTRYAISLLIDRGQPSVAAAASNLGVSARSLQRALEREGKTFAELLAETRRELALRYLGSSLPITAIAEMVGYAGSSSFSRWFAAEFGETPLAYRARQEQARKNWPGTGI
jgi:AraC-like DNA-binding protein